MTEEELDAIASRPPIEWDWLQAAGRRVYLVEWERDALVAEVRYWRSFADAVVRDHTLLPVSQRTDNRVQYWDDDAKGWIDHPVENGPG